MALGARGGEERRQPGKSQCKCGKECGIKSCVLRLSFFMTSSSSLGKI